MCGFSGFISFTNQATAAKKILEMNRMISHRGPDGEGYFFFGDKNYLNQANSLPEAKSISHWHSRESRIQGALGHRRLSIIDLSEKALQPMHLEDGSLSIIFNGEIYNHQEIRKELMALGHKFFTDHSDTEVVLRAYREWGMECIHHFRGMFAIVLMDFAKEKIYLIRDRIGVKPLYYTIQNNQLSFGSEIKAILKILPGRPKARAQSIFDYMTFLTVPAPHTMYEGIFKLEAGHYLEFQFDGKYQKREYWDPLDQSTKIEKSQADWEKDILASLRNSVKLRMESDVPVGVFLSGGIDSSINSVLFSELTKSSVKTFTVGYDDAVSHSNEFPQAKMVADLIQSEHFERRIQQQELIDFLPKMAFHQDEPLADPVCIPVYFIAKLARDNGVTVCQVGEGSDELFIGYTDWITKYKLEHWGRFPLPAASKHFAYSILNNLSLSTSTAREFLRRNANGLPVFWSGAEAFTEAEKDQLFSKSFLTETDVQKPDQWIRDLYQKFLQRSPDASFYDWMSYADLKLRLPELLLMRVDKMTMACGLEARVPFLDHKFVMQSFSIEEKMKVQNEENKYLLKRAVAPLLPEEIVYRKKQGFSVPVTEWLSQALGTKVEDSIWRLQEETKMFDPDALKLFLEQKHRGVWNLFNLALWNECEDLKPSW
jgi:asparagine synthase (glutamine-hydrolysing)